MEWRSAVDVQGIQIIRTKAAYRRCNEHNDLDIQLQSETVNNVKTLEYNFF